MISEVITITGEINTQDSINGSLASRDEITSDITLPTVVGIALPEGGNAGDLLIKKTATNYDAEWVAPATSAEQDNTRPITAAAVYTEIGNINALLQTI